MNNVDIRNTNDGFDADIQDLDLSLTITDHSPDWGGANGFRGLCADWRHWRSGKKKQYLCPKA